MGFGQKGGFFRPSPAAAPAGSAASTKQRGDAAEDAALAFLQKHGLRLQERNFKTPGRGGGEIDLIMREPDGTLVFVEVRQRASAAQGGAAGSVTATKQRRIVLAARHFLHRLGSEPPCRFDVVLIQGGAAGQPNGTGASPIQWLRAAFDASATF
ncbi:YraN family protein [Hydrogenophaga sp.]|uniref:YraN family protein n=1 Tax=Hydrogenophaga sp. TaxID=1904254 RepID=UPI0026244F5F|nr:YraN family protein [Hydrogenophaga sp.]MDM7948925.1 YraN family protein [Hydrogenophaga sp.]